MKKIIFGLLGLIISLPTIAATSRHELYQKFDGCGERCVKTAVEAAPVKRVVKKQEARPVKKATNVRRSATADRMLGDPFFQNQTGKFLSLTDLGFAENTYDFMIPFGAGKWGGANGDWQGSEWSVREDLSLGITDEISVLGMIKYAKTKYEMGWDAFSSTLGHSYPASYDKNTDSGVSTWGVGLQWKFMDNAYWVGNVGAYYQNARDLAHIGVGSLKLGYRATPQTTIYGAANVSMLHWADTSYGNGIFSDAGQVAYIAFNTDVKNSFYIEGSVGTFARLSDQWGLDLSATFGDYDWHSQAYGRAAIYWQPLQSFSLGLYARASFYDSADSNKELYMYSWGGAEPPTPPAAFNMSDPTCQGNVHLSGYSDIAYGLHLLLYF
ncbi:MAG: hypothetical protein LBL75_02035 [Rickettsiales bacterium]|jgi:hypothetical protein|nr:hypothetical protein [Rickettsiales bacterium]